MKSTEEIAESVFRRRDQYQKEKRKQMKRAASVLSCFCLVAILGTVIWQYVWTLDNVEGKGEVQSPDAFVKYEDVEQPAQESKGNLEGEQTAQESKENLQEKQPDQERKENLQEEIPSSEIEDYASAEGEDTFQDEDSAASVTGIDRPVTDHPGDTGALTAYEEAWGGSYMDQNGCWVVLLTEDTPENRQMVFNLNPTLSEDRVIFKAANYSEAYLTELMVNISRAMGTGELSFVSTAALREDKNCVEVTISTEDAGNRERILAFDPIGGAIEIVVSDSSIYNKGEVEELKKDPMP